MKVICWKKRYLPEASWTVYSLGEDGVAQPVLTAESKDEMTIKLATIGYELDSLDLQETDGVIEVWTVRRFPGNSLERQ